MGYVVVSREDNKLCQWCSEFTVVRLFCPEGEAGDEVPAAGAAGES